jgi:hypothetical protein
MYRAFLLLVAVCCAACGHQVGDACSTNVDCSPQGDRFCDTSAPAGYCTIDGCDWNTCPSEAVCVRFFTPVLDEPCVYNPNNPFGVCPHPDDRCVCDVANGLLCQNNMGHCAPESTERRWCQKQCSSPSDCRAGYECRASGSRGAESVPNFDMSIQPVKFCAPMGAHT